MGIFSGKPNWNPTRNDFAVCGLANRVEMAIDVWSGEWGVGPVQQQVAIAMAKIGAKDAQAAGKLKAKYGQDAQIQPI